MDSFNDIWTAWNQEWGVTVATIVASIALVVSLSEKLQRMVSAICRWRIWTLIINIYGALKKWYRMHRAKQAMYAKLDQTSITIQIGTYDHCLSQSQHSSVQKALGNITPEKPRWLDDYFVATALESLANDGKVAKAMLYVVGRWPPSAQTYLFQRRKANRSVQDEVREIETNSMCATYQSTSECPMEFRHERGTVAETTAPGRTEFRNQIRLKDGVPPCELCWERKARRTNISMLVENITKYDLAEIVTKEIIGESNEFQQAVINACMENKCQADAGTIKEIVRRAIEIRSNQLKPIAPGRGLEWTAQSTEEFSASLSVYINEEAQ